jgi:signal transduction histidine kinase
MNTFFSKLRFSSQNRDIFLLALFMIVGLYLIIKHFSSLTNNIIKATALQDAAMYSEALEEFRSIYTAQVVNRLVGHGIEITHDYKDKEKAIPLPATLSMELANAISKKSTRTISRLYSNYPFPWRTEGGPQDTFESEALIELQKNPDKPFYRFENYQGQPYLRYAVADLLRESCVNCHNSHPESPKTDWKQGDVRGVLEVNWPMETFNANVKKGLKKSKQMIWVITTFWIILLGWMMYRVQRYTMVLNQKVNELAESNQELDDFAYIASHDLKEPLRGIHNYSSIIIEDYQDKLDSEGQSKLTTLIRLSKRMENLINDLLYFSRVGRTDINRKDVDLNILVAEITDSLQVLIAEKQVEIRIEQPLPIISCDQIKITEVFHNLLTNAIKYNDKEQKYVEIGFQTQYETKANLIFYVRDNGIGIKENHIGKVFKLFKRLHGQSKFGGGTGAGLTIVKKIIQRHGGKIWLESIPKQGTTFYFTIH